MPGYGYPQGSGETRTSCGANKTQSWRESPSHATWCNTNVPFARRPSAGYTPGGMGGGGCNCTRNALAKSLRKLAALQGETP